MDVPTLTLLGYVGVDSGQLIVTDPCYLNTWIADEHDSVVKDLNGHLPLQDNIPYSYGGACAASCSKELGGEIGLSAGGVVFSSGFGDGVYPVYAEIQDFGDSDKRISRVIIDLIFDNELKD